MMEERIRPDGFEATFVVSTPRAKAWELLLAAEKRQARMIEAELKNWMPTRQECKQSSGAIGRIASMTNAMCSSRSTARPSAPS